MSKIDSGYVWTAVTIKLGCVPGKGIIGLLWSSLNVWRPSKFSFRGFLSVTYTHLELWYHKARVRARQRHYRAFIVEFKVWRPSKFSFRDFYPFPIPIWNCGIIKLRYVPGKWVIGLLWSSLNVWRPSKFSLRFFISYLLPSEIVVS